MWESVDDNPVYRDLGATFENVTIARCETKEAKSYLC